MAILKLKLIAREEVARQTIVLSFQKPADFTFKPGQYGGFTLLNHHEALAGGITRRFSLLSPPDDAKLSIVTRLQASAYKHALNQLAIGDEIKFAGPTGNFVLHEDLAIPAVFIAGGIGIAPFYCMIRHAVNHAGPPIQLFFGNRSETDAPFFKELNALQNQSNFTMHAVFEAPPPHWQGPIGFIDESLVRAKIPDIFQPIYYICGSPAMVTFFQEMLAEMGIDEEKIRIEDFPGY